MSTLYLVWLVLVAAIPALREAASHKQHRYSQRPAGYLESGILTGWTRARYGRRLLTVQHARHSIRVRFAHRSTCNCSWLIVATLLSLAVTIVACVAFPSHQGVVVRSAATAAVGLVPLLLTLHPIRHSHEHRRGTLTSPKTRILYVRGYESRPWAISVHSSTSIAEILADCRRTHYGAYTGPLDLYLSSRLLPLPFLCSVAELRLDSLLCIDVRMGLPGGAPIRSERKSHNKKGANQHRDEAIIDQYPYLPSLIQKLIWDNVKIKDLANELQKHHGIEDVSQRSIERIKKEWRIQTARRNNGSPEDWAEALASKQNEVDPLRKMGARDLQDEMRTSEQLMIPRGYIESFLQVSDPEAADMRRAGARKKHTAGLWSIGPDEEWSFDGHEKLRKEMDLALYCGVDKYSRFILGLYVVARHQQPDVGAAIYALCVHEHGRCPLQSVTDMETETSHMAVLQNTLYRLLYPALNPEEIPPHQFRKSTENITVERSWRWLYDKVLANVLEKYISGKHSAGFLVARPVHRVLARWLWAQALQRRLDEYVAKYNTHRIRSQKSNLPSGAVPRDIYHNPEKFGGIRARDEKLDSQFTKALVDRYVPDDLFRFGTVEEVAVMEQSYQAIGAPAVDINSAWTVFGQMLPTVEFAMAGFVFADEEGEE